MTFNAENQPRRSVTRSEAMENQFHRFDLLSAYLDGEATPSERKQVQQWLDTDPQFRQQYHQLLRLQQSISRLPIPAPESVPSELSCQVFQKIDRQRHQRRLLVVGGMAIATLLTGLASHLYLRENSPGLQLASNAPTAPVKNSDSLTIALNHPIVELPSFTE